MHRLYFSALHKFRAAAYARIVIFSLPGKAELCEYRLGSVLGRRILGTYGNRRSLEFRNRDDSALPERHPVADTRINRGDDTQLFAPRLLSRFCRDIRGDERQIDLAGEQRLKVVR